MGPIGRSVVVVGLGYGDEAKGATVDYAARTYGCSLVVRFCSGPQAAHNVVTPAGTHHCFSQFGSASLVDEIPTYLARFFIVDPIALENEAAHLADLGVSDPLGLMRIDEGAAVVTPYHRGLNHLREIARGDDRHGSVGLGVGEVGKDRQEGNYVLTVGELLHRDLPKRLAKIRSAKWVEAFQMSTAIQDLTHPQAFEQLPPAYFRAMEYLHTDPQWLAERYWSVLEQCQVTTSDMLGVALLGDTPVIFEGAQGALLDESVGFHPHTTWSTTTPGNALTLLSECDPSGQAAIVGCTRTYTTRHGPGPLPTEDEALLKIAPESHNVEGEWQGQFRVGHLDLVALRYAVEAVRPDAIALSHLDVVDTDWKVATALVGRRSRRRFSRIPRPPALTHENLRIKHTQVIAEASPVYETLGQVTPQADLVEMVQARMGVPVTIAAWGPSAQDRGPWEHSTLRLFD